VGTRADGSVFEEKTNFQFVVGAEEVISGLDQAVATMKLKEKCIVDIAPALAYGSSGNPSLNIGSDKIKYEIELIDFTTEKERWEMSLEERFEAATRKKEQGNALFAEGKLDRACKKYQACLDLYEYPLHCNYKLIMKI
jgi:FK506-binding protein 4/5